MTIIMKSLLSVTENGPYRFAKAYRCGLGLQLKPDNETLLANFGFDSDRIAIKCADKVI